jgi:hypothetical protein
VNKEGIEVATMIRARIKEVTGLNASAGISYCEFLTKIASDLNKPNAQAVITPRMGPIFVEALPLGTDKPSVQLAAARLELGAVIPTSAGGRSDAGSHFQAAALRFICAMTSGPVENSPALAFAVSALRYPPAEVISPERSSIAATAIAASPCPIASWASRQASGETPSADRARFAASTRSPARSIRPPLA